ncbi:hypothetical protein Ae201684P_006666 [Aphanomyces euteiches]|nr:hypothetical protein Ae201684P_006666 [Aphanomyces euteiches]
MGASDTRPDMPKATTTPPQLRPPPAPPDRPPDQPRAHSQPRRQSQRLRLRQHPTGTLHMEPNTLANSSTTSPPPHASQRHEHALDTSPEPQRLESPSHKAINDQVSLACPAIHPPLHPPVLLATGLTSLLSNPTHPHVLPGASTPTALPALPTSAAHSISALYIPVP